MADWVTISSLATAGGTLVLAVATFSSVRSSNRSARVAELALLSGLRPLIPSHEDDAVERVRFGDDHRLMVPGHGGTIELADGNIYMAMALRNGGIGLAVIHGWRADQLNRELVNDGPDVADFRRQSRDLYIPAGYTGFWQGAIRDRMSNCAPPRRPVSGSRSTCSTATTRAVSARSRASGSGTTVRTVRRGPRWSGTGTSIAMTLARTPSSAPRTIRKPLSILPAVMQAHMEGTT